jgi:phosphoribosylformylglycinamidine cyclo-ligase
VRGIVHCSGGGQTKCLRFGRGVHFIKDNLFAPPPIFRAIQRVSKTPWREMFQVYNMGHRMEIYCLRRDAKKVIELAQSYGIAAQQIGHTQKSDSHNKLTLQYANKRFEYSLSL